jgi:hypothetical protein
MGCMFQFTNPSVGKRFFSSSIHSYWLRGPCNLLSIWYWDSFPQVKWQGHDVDYLPPSSAEDKTEWISAVPVCHHDLDKENVILVFTIMALLNVKP